MRLDFLHLCLVQSQRSDHNDKRQCKANADTGRTLTMGVSKWNDFLMQQPLQCVGEDAFVTPKSNEAVQRLVKVMN